MAEVLALGISHYPFLATPDDRMSWILKYMLEHPHLPEEYRNPDNWPEKMKREWGEDEGTASAARHRTELVHWTGRVRAALDDFNPDYVLIIGDDQYENFKEDIIPPFCINAYDKYTWKAQPGNVWGEPSSKEFEVAGVPQKAKELTSKLIESGFDMSYSYKPLHQSLGHAFYYGFMYLDYERKLGFPYPAIPLAVNCYGRHVIAQKGGLPQFDKVLAENELDPPAPTSKRLLDLGAQIGRVLKDGPDRVAIIASSGWSHAFLVDKFYGLYPDIEADRKMFDAMVSGDWDVWRNLTGKEVEDSGQQEMLNWSCMLGAVAELGLKPTESGLVTTHIFNSSKAYFVAS